MISVLQAKQFMVTKLYLEGCCAYCIPVRVPYHTSAMYDYVMFIYVYMTRDDLALDVQKQLSGDNMIGFGIIRVRRTISGYTKVHLA